MPAGPSPAHLSLHLADPRRQATTLRNVAGLLRGSDPALGTTCVLVSAHYDGTGPEPGTGGTDRIWNGANDDASGTSAVIELAAALSRLSPRPRRSIGFLAFFGEEQGLLGSAYYAAHPLLPLERTLAVLNLEHLGRTDSAQGSRAGTLSVTGDDYSDLPAVLVEAGQATGIDVVSGDRRSDRFFEASDNYPLAAAGLVAHTLAVVYDDWPDYHGPHDEWPKIDFANMERTVRMVGAAALMLADSDAEPRWRDVSGAAPYRTAWEARHTDRPGPR
jgi:Zn-dependent M28 family amino/carboxypeptidase